MLPMAHPDNRATTSYSAHFGPTVPARSEERGDPPHVRGPAEGGPAGRRPSGGPSEAPPAIPISAAAERLGTTARMLRYREALGLIPPTKEQPTGRGHRHRRFSGNDLAAVSAGLDLERSYGIPPAALAFALRVLAEPAVLAQVRSFGERVGRLAPAPARAMDFEKQKALRLLQRREQPPGGGRPAQG
ncbi:hypothetical protein GCM10023224_47250 [Streptomonospora halophila]|uniref:HTH merR-type domain-containing protein n=1 Tax=Streptomonospora halophila TaxID=427369 RepID=A0ABP9H163_9ACTN